MPVESWIAAILVGLVGMMSGGYWGVGSGWIVTPTMLILGFPPLQAVGIGLLQMVPSTLPTVLKQAPKIGWHSGGLGRRLVIPMAAGAVLTSLAGKPVNAVLVRHFGSVPLDVMLCVFIGAIGIQTLGSKTRCYDDSEPELTPKTGIWAFGGGLATGLVSSLLGVGGGIVIRPLLTGGFELAEEMTGRIVRLMVLITTLVGGITYLFRGTGVEWPLLQTALSVAAGGMVGFPLGVRMHQIVYEAGYAQHIHKSFAVIALAMLINSICRLTGFGEVSRWIMLGIGIGLVFYLAGFTAYAKKHPRRSANGKKSVKNPT